MLPNPLAVNTWIRFTESESFYHNYRRNDEVLFMGWISNPIGSASALIMDERGLQVIVLQEEYWEVV